jgi:ribosome biogenesis protein ERB1
VAANSSYPNAKLPVIAIASGQRMLLMTSKVSDKLLIKKTNDILMEAPKTDLNDDERLKIAVECQTQTRELHDESVRIVLKHFKEVNGHNEGLRLVKINFQALVNLANFSRI